MSTSTRGRSGLDSAIINALASVSASKVAETWAWNAGFFATSATFGDVQVLQLTVL